MPPLEDEQDRVCLRVSALTAKGLTPPVVHDLLPYRRGVLVPPRTQKESGSLGTRSKPLLFSLLATTRVLIEFSRRGAGWRDGQRAR